MKKGYQADNIMREERENLEKQLALERRSIQEITTEYLQSKSQIKDDNNPETPQRKKLKRDMDTEALERAEIAAKTVSDYKGILEWWDRLDANRERKERFHEVSRGDNVPLDYGAADGGMYFPRSLNRSVMRQINKGDFTDAIYNCPFELDELVTEPYISQILKKLKPEQKEVLYYIAVKGYSIKVIAQLRGQTERNIRKVRDTMLRKIQKQMYEYLTSPQSQNYSMTQMEKHFIERYEKIQKNN